MTAFLDTPVMRTVERMEQPSRRQEITLVLVAVSRRFMMMENTTKAALVCQVTTRH